MGGNIKILRLKNMIKEKKTQQPLVDMKPCESTWNHTLNIQELDEQKLEFENRLKSDTLSSTQREKLGTVGWVPEIYTNIYHLYMGYILVV